MARKLYISLRKLMWQELPPDIRANKKVANAIYHFKKPYVGGYEHFSAAASSSQKGVRMMSSLNQWLGAMQQAKQRRAAGDGMAVGCCKPLPRFKPRCRKPRPWLQALGCKPQLSHSQEVYLG